MTTITGRPASSPSPSNLTIDIIAKSGDAKAMRYPGGKGKTYQHLINLMPPHQTYIESHLGGGAVLRNKKPATRSIGIDIDPDVISTWKARYSSLCELVNGNAHEFLRDFQYTGNELIYADPPYLQETRLRARVYSFDYTNEEHEVLLKILSNVPCMVALSGYDSALYNDTLSGWEKITFQSKTHTSVRTECVWLNYKVGGQLHDARYLGDDFKERQLIKRRQLRLKNKIEKMSEIERSELLEWLNKKYSNTIGGFDAERHSLCRE